MVIGGEGRTRLSLDVTGMLGDTQDLEVNPLLFPSFPLTHEKEAQEGGPLGFRCEIKRAKLQMLA